MPTLTYIGYGAEGYKVGGSSKLSQDQLKSHLDSKNIINYEIYESKTSHKSGAFALVSPKELSIFCKQMSVLFFSHITLMEGIVILHEQTENPQLKQALIEVHDHMERGNTFAESMLMYTHIFGSYLSNIIMIGETSGTLDSIFSRMSQYFEKESKVRKKLKSAIIYPAILTTLMSAIVLLLILKILPMFNGILQGMGGEMPTVTKLILSVSTFISNYIFIILALIIIVVVLIYCFIRTEKGKYWIDKIKVTSSIPKFVNSRVVTSRFSRSISILLRSGVQLLNAMEDTAAVIDNRYLDERFAVATQKVKQGVSLHEALGEIGIFPTLFLKMVVIGQNTGHIDEMLEKSADVFDDEVDEAIERFTVMLEPILIIILSVIVGIILLSVMLPMIDIMSQIG